MRKNLYVSEVNLHGYSLAGALIEVERELKHTFCQEKQRKTIRFITGFDKILRPGIRNYLLIHPLVREMGVDGHSTWIDLWENKT